MSKDSVKLDVREDIRRGREPFSKIMRAVSELGADQDLLLIAPFEPAPLYKVLAKQGFAHRATETKDGDWEVLFFRDQAEPAAAEQAAEPSVASGGKSDGPQVVDVDARGLEPPQPLVTILEALEALPDGATLRARTDRRPMHLLTQVEERGFTAQVEEQNDGSFITQIRRR